jgi:hypothetical protein
MWIRCIIDHTIVIYIYIQCNSIIIIIISGVGLLVLWPLTGLLYQPQMIGDGDCWRNWWIEDMQGKPKYSEKTCRSATLSTTNPTWLDPGLNPARRGGKPATNRLSYGTAYAIQ